MKINDMNRMGDLDHWCGIVQNNDQNADQRTQNAHAQRDEGNGNLKP
jgi:hypothetical protein